MTIARSPDTHRASPRMLRGVVASLLLVASSIALTPRTAHADDAPSNWWYDKYNVAAAQQAGWTGQGVKVAVIDGGINTSLPVFAGADITVHEPSFCDGSAADKTTANLATAHGTDVSSLIVGSGKGIIPTKGIAPKAHLTFYADGNSSGTLEGCSQLTGPGGLKYDSTGLALRQAIADGNRIISISSAGTNLYPGTQAALTEALSKGVIVVAATPNEASNADQQFPWNANGVVSTNAFGQDGKLQVYDGKQVGWQETTVIAAGVNFPSQSHDNPWRWLSNSDNPQIVQGSSLSTPLVAGMLADAMQKWPKATGNQLIQSLIHNTWQENGQAVAATDGTGYGPASLTKLLNVDPTQYPDTNPLMNKSTGVPTQQDIDNAAQAAAPTPTATTPATPPPTNNATAGNSNTGGISPLIVGLIITLAVLIILAIAGTIILITTLSRRSRQQGGHP